MRHYRNGNGLHHARAIVRHVFNFVPDDTRELAYWYGLALGFLNEQRQLDLNRQFYK